MYGYVSNYTGIFMHFQGGGVKFLGEGDLYSCGGCVWNIHIYSIVNIYIYIYDFYTYNYNAINMYI